MDLSKKVALVTGGGRGIGAGISLRLAEAGATVLIGYNTGLAEANAVAKEAEALGYAPPAPVHIDIDDYESVVAAMRTAADRYGRIDILVNNAGVGNAGTVLPINPVTDWTDTVRTNLFGTLHCIKAASLHMLVARSGSIVNVTSVAGLIGVAGLSGYGASKAGIMGMTRALCREFAPYGVRVNSVAPGFTDDTGMVARIDDEKMTGFLGRIALGRLATRREIANAVCFLASDEASYISGHTLVVDGGFSV